MCGNQPLPSGSGYAALYNLPLQVGYGPVNDGFEVAHFRVLHVVQYMGSVNLRGGECLVKWSAYKFSVSIQPSLFRLSPGSMCGPAQPSLHAWSPFHLGPHILPRPTVLSVLQTYYLLCPAHDLSRMTGGSQYLKFGGGVLQPSGSG